MCDSSCPPFCPPMMCCEVPMCDPCPMPCDSFEMPCSPCEMPCSPCPMPCDPCCPPRRCKSRELRSSILMTQCDCTKRNGLQHDCPRSECRGRPLCTIKPIPDCCPSKYMWRYANVTMGKPAFAAPRKPCAKKVGDCNPCVVDCIEPSCYRC